MYARFGMCVAPCHAMPVVRKEYLYNLPPPSSFPHFLQTPSDYLRREELLGSKTMPPDATPTNSNSISSMGKAPSWVPTARLASMGTRSLIGKHPFDLRCVKQTQPKLELALIWFLERQRRFEEHVGENFRAEREWELLRRMIR